MSKESGYYEIVTITLKSDREEHEKLLKERKKAAAKSRSRSRSKGRKTRAKKDPTKPKGKKSAWIFYTIAKRPSAKKRYPEYSMTDITKVLSKKWNKESDEVKAKYEAMAELNNNNNMSKESGYYEIVTITLKSDREEHEKLLKERKKAAAKSRSRSRSKGRKTRAKKDPTKPKGKKSAWIFYTIAKRPSAKKRYPEYSMTDITKVLSKKWNKESDEVKAKYEAMANKDAKRWERETHEWKKKNKRKSKATSSSESS
eukprot:TRINITY_DN4442_c0_g1_i1.p1 TRINITY_DN4442_c0_g1~~TRINITY_DN4442_c0_g1_i1.p1  ORF type:complete len:271 (-),score=80.65 TRINITY_DN4442_c0_g1_i1:43-813(-)